MSQVIATNSIASDVRVNRYERMHAAQAEVATAGAFARVLQDQRQPAGVDGSTKPLPSTVVKPGDTLIAIVQRFGATQGQTVSASDAYRLAVDLAKDNGIANPDRIWPGQRLTLSGLMAALSADRGGATAGMQASSPLGASPAQDKPTPSQAVLSQRSLQPESSRSVDAPGRMRSDSATTPILTRTLDRAVAKGFVPAQERQAVYSKIVQLSEKFGFSPDDFARMSLMESDGLNPKASNNRCHGIIQFCDGPDRGAASAGFAKNPRAILNRSVLQQLDLVAKYFDDTGLDKSQRVGLDDLYLTVLTPAARSESRQFARLNIAGTQSEYLHLNNDRRLPITRQSLVQGLHQNARERLGMAPEAYDEVSRRATPSVAALQRSAPGLGAVWLASANGKK